MADVDAKLSNSQKNELLIEALPGAVADVYGGEQVIRIHDQLILRKQVTHLGFPWPEFKKRIQIPKRWIDVHRQAVSDGLRPRFVGIYHYGEVTIFVDFEPTTYVGRKANNSAAHVATNDLFQAQTLGQFSREDKNGNRLTAVRSHEFARYLRRGYEEQNPYIEVFDQFNDAFLGGERIEALDAIQEMHAVGWPDTFQSEWAGFYVEFRLSSYLAANNHGDLVVVQKEKRKGGFDYDLRFLIDTEVDYYGDLKASNIALNESPGNDAADFFRCLAEFGRFWYVIYEHETWHGRDNRDVKTVEWNEWRRSVGHQQRGIYDPLSYAGRFKESVRFVRMKILEVNQANCGLVLGDFKQGAQVSGAARNLKVKILKKDIDNFLIYSKTVVAA